MKSDRVVTIDEVAQAMGISRGLAYRQAEAGGFPFPCSRIGKRFVIPRKPFEAFLETGMTTNAIRGAAA